MGGRIGGYGMRILGAGQTDGMRVGGCEEEIGW